MAFATQLSVPGLPITPSYLALALWIVLSTGRIVLGHSLVMTDAFKQLARFWLGLAIALSIGTLVGYFKDELSISDALHDVASYVFLALLTCLSVAESDLSRRLRVIAWYVVIIGQLALLVQAALAWNLLHQSGVELWYWDVRFQGWSENPNQLALYCAILGPLGLYLATTSERLRPALAGFVSMILPFYMGRLTESDTYVLATIATYVPFLFLQLRAGPPAGGRISGITRKAAVFLLALSIPLCLALVPLGLTNVDDLHDFAKGLTRGKGGPATERSTEQRLHLWDGAFEKGLYSGSLGLGPGPHVDRPANRSGSGASLIVPKEAHNTILDFYTQGGLMAVLLLVWIVSSAAARVWHAKLDGLLGLMASIVVFSIFHLTVRHPIVWFGIALCLAARSHPVEVARLQPAVLVARPST